MNDSKREACPCCGSGNIAEILWGKPAFTDELKQKIDNGTVSLGGCCFDSSSPRYHCNECDAEFGRIKFDMPWPKKDDRLKAIVYGAAVGDALGVPFEFQKRGTFACTRMVAGGVHGMPAGTFSDDTSLLLATCDSIRAHGGKIKPKDMANRFKKWLYEGAYTPDGRVFDVGNTVATALDQGHGCTGERSNGNGSLMRIAPLALTDADEAQIAAVSAITHAHPISGTACVAFVSMLRDVLRGMSLPNAIRGNIPSDERFSFLESVEEKDRDEIQSSGFVLHTLEAALWCNLRSESYAECVKEAVNLGSDADTTACVAGALAGALYGYRAIPDKWVETLRGKDVIDACLFETAQ